MTGSQDDGLRARKRLLQNPYAFIEELEPEEAHRAGPRRNSSNSLSFSEATKADLRSARLAAQNPYSYLDGEGNFSAMIRETPKEVVPSREKNPGKSYFPRFETPRLKRAGSYTDEEIETVARKMQQFLWEHRYEIWQTNTPSDPIEVLDLEVASEVNGYSYSHSEGLGRSDGRHGRFEVAGIIDSQSNQIIISRQFDPQAQRFTGAHELGHAVLHAPSGVVHRDRSMDGSSRARDTMEREADKFASYFLMPGKLVKKEFLSIFGVSPFVLNEASAFALIGEGLIEAERRFSSVRELALLLGSVESYNGRRHVSLCQKFGVSRMAMAIRLEELGIVK